MASTTKQMNIRAGNAQATVNATVNDSMPAIPCPDPAGYRYVGARYVPLFADPLQWSNANTYEPLTIVVNEGNSYTSKTFVPAGIDISNTDYWALTGNYNAQIEQYRQEVQAFDGRITDVESAVSKLNNEVQPNMVVIGDSFSDPSYLIGSSVWPLQLARMLNLNCYNYAKAGAGFTIGADVEPHSTFSDMLDIAANDSAFDNSSVQYVFLLGGTNDLRKASGNINLDTLNTAISACCQKMIDLFPNSKLIYVGSSCFENFTNVATTGGGTITELYFQRFIGQQFATITCLNMTAFWINLPYFFEDGYVGHPNSSAHFVLAKSIIKGMLGVTSFTRRFAINLNKEDITSNTDYQLRTMVSGINSMVLVDIDDRRIKFTVELGLSTDNAWPDYIQYKLPFNTIIPEGLFNIAFIPKCFWGELIYWPTDASVGTKVLPVFNNLMDDCHTWTIYPAFNGDIPSAQSLNLDIYCSFEYTY